MAVSSNERWIALEIPALPWSVAVVVDEYGGQAVITGLRLDPKPGAPVQGTAITSRLLQTFPLRALKEALARYLLAEFEQQQRPPEFRRPFPDEHYRWVATAYEVAAQAGQPPVKFVAEYFGRSHAAAKKYVAEARRRGFITDAPGRVAGSAHRGVGARSGQPVVGKA